MGSTYEIYKELTNLKASKITKKNPMGLSTISTIVLNDSDKVNAVLGDNEEVFFELESQDLWLQVVFHMHHLDELLIYGVTEVRIEKTELLQNLKKKL